MYYFAMMRQNNIFGVELFLVWRHQMAIRHANIVQQSGRCTFALTFFNVLEKYGDVILFFEKCKVSFMLCDT